MKQEAEIWKDVVGWDGYYQVSSQGRVRSVDRVIQTKNGPRKLPSAYLPGHHTVEGYIRVGLCKNGVGKTFFTHRLLALAFIPNPHNKPEINHKNGVKNDNRLENIEWVTTSENQRHSFDVLGNKTIAGMGLLDYKIIPDKTFQDLYNHLKSGGTIAQFSGITGISKRYLRSVTSGKNRKKLNINWAEVYTPDQKHNTSKKKSI